MSQGLIPAKTLAAVYDPRSSELTLFATGVVPIGVYDIHFERVTWLGGLKFELLGRTLLGPIGERSYEYEQKIPIILPSRVYPSDSVIIVTQNNQPQGEKVVIHWLGLKTSPPVQSLEADAKDTVTTIAKDSETRYEVIGKEFKVQQAAQVPSHGSLTMDYDSQNLLLVTASIEDKNIVYTFRSLQLGATSIVFFGVGGIAKYVWRQQLDFYIIRPWLPINPTDDDKANGLQENTTTPKDSDSNIVIFRSFKDNILEAQSIVKKSFPDATLRIADAKLPPGVPSTTNPFLLKKLSALFVSQEKKCTIRMESAGAMSWGPPVVTADIVVGVTDVDMTALKVEMEEAAAKVKQPFFSVTLAHIVALGIKEPRYGFKGKGGATVYVGAMTGDVSTDLTGLGLDAAGSKE